MKQTDEDLKAVYVAWCMGAEVQYKWEFGTEWHDYASYKDHTKAEGSAIYEKLHKIYDNRYDQVTFRIKPKD